MNIKVLSALLIIFLIMAACLKSLYDDKQALIMENQNLSADKAKLSKELTDTIEENSKRLKAFEEREQALLNDRKELQNEYERLLELKKSDTHYLSWSDVPLPDSVSSLLP